MVWPDTSFLVPETRRSSSSIIRQPNTLYRETRQRRVPDDADSSADNDASFKRKIVSWRSCLKKGVSFTEVSGGLGRLGYALVCSNLLLSFSIVLSRCCCCLSSAVLRFYLYVYYYYLQTSISTVRYSF